MLVSFIQESCSLFQYAFSVKEDSEVMIALMQEDTRKEKERGIENLTIGYFVMKVKCKREFTKTTAASHVGTNNGVNEQNNETERTKDNLVGFSAVLCKTTARN